MISSPLLPELVQNLVSSFILLIFVCYFFFSECSHAHALHHLPPTPCSIYEYFFLQSLFFSLRFFPYFAPLVSFFHDRSFLQITDNPKLLWKLSWLVGLVDVEIQSKMMCILSLQSCPTLCDAMGCSLPSSSVHGILQARTLEWVTMPSSRGSSQPRD